MIYYPKKWKMKTKNVTSRSLHTQPTACVAAPHTLPVNYAELQNQLVGCVRYARTRSVDWRFAVSTFNFVETTNHFFSNTQTTNKNPMARYRRNFIAGGTFFFTVKLADPKSRLLVEHMTYCVRLILMCKNNIPLKPSPYVYCRTIFTPFGRCRPTMWITPCAGGWLKPNSPHISLVPKTCLPANSGGTNAVFGNGVFTNTPCATKSICSAAQTIYISIPSNMDCAAMSAIGRFRRFTVMFGTDGCRWIGAAQKKQR